MKKIIYNLANIANWITQPDTIGISPFDAIDLKSIFCQYAKLRSDINYSYVHSNGNIGKYQFNYIDFISFGYVKNIVTSNSDLFNNKFWCGGENMPHNLQEFIDSHSTQELCMLQKTQKHIEELQTLGIFTNDNEHNAGLLLCRLSGDLNTFNNYQIGILCVDDYNNPYELLYDYGRFAIQVLNNVSISDADTEFYNRGW